MTITQTVDIPASRRLTIDVPREIPVGMAILTLAPAIDQRASEATPISDSLVGVLSGLGDITIEQIRDERLAKHLK